VHLLTCRVEELQAELRNSRPENSSRPHAAPGIVRTENEYGQQEPQGLEPVQPQFVGATRSAFDLNVARSSMNNMGIPTDLPNGSATDDPVATLRKEPLELALLFQPLRELGKEKVLALIKVFEEELNPAYPYLDVPELTSLVYRLFERYGGDEASDVEGMGDNQHAIDQLQFMVLAAVVACAMAVDSPGRIHTSQQLVRSAQRYVFDDVGSGRATHEEIVISITLVRLCGSFVIPIAYNLTRVSITFMSTRTC
jgi:hypothetical protein